MPTNSSWWFTTTSPLTSRLSIKVRACSTVCSGVMV
jgi:hypothetical protein